MPESGNKREQRKKEIIQAALKVFSEKGFNGSTTKEIAREAGIAEGTIFRYFKTKKDLLLAVAANQTVDVLIDTIKELPKNDEEAFLRAILKNRMSMIKTHFDTIKVLLSESQFHPELREKFAEDVILKAVGIMEQYMTEKIQDGTFRQVNTKIAVRALVGMLQIFILWHHIFDGTRYLPVDEEEIINTIVDIFLNGIRTQPKREER